MATGAKMCSETTVLLGTDQQRSPLNALTGKNSGTSSYTCYGLGGGAQSRIGFNGKLKDSVLNSYFLGNGYRVYSPVLMRFCSPDSLSPFDQGGFNSYGYCSGDPVNFSDPTGHMLAPSGGGSPKPTGAGVSISEFMKRRLSGDWTAPDPVPKKAYNLGDLLLEQDWTEIGFQVSHPSSVTPSTSTIKNSISKTKTTPNKSTAKRVTSSVMSERDAERLRKYNNSSRTFIGKLSYEETRAAREIVINTKSKGGDATNALRRSGIKMTEEEIKTTTHSVWRYQKVLGLVRR